MNKTISSAFTYMFNDKDWVYKLFILSMLALPESVIGYMGEKIKTLYHNLNSTTISCLIALGIISIMAYLIFIGYCSKCCHNIINADAVTSRNNLLPKWEDDFGQFLKIGFSYNLALAAITGVFALLIGLGFVDKSLILIIAIPLLIFALIFSYYFTALEAIFCTKFELTSFFKLKKAHKLVSNNTGKYILILTLISIVSILSGLIPALFIKSHVALLLAPILQVYTFLVFAYFKGILFPTKPKLNRNF